MITINFTPSVINLRPKAWLALCLRGGVILFIYMCKEIVVYARQIPLSKTGRKNKGKYFALVGYWWFDWLNQWSWSVVKAKYTCYGIRKQGKVTIPIHNIILKVPSDNLVDHEDHNGLNCLPHNLREATRSQNNANRKAIGMSKYLGVAIFRNGKYTYWKSYIKTNGKICYLGSFAYNEKGEMEAAITYDNAARIYHGEFANLNFK